MPNYLLKMELRKAYDTLNWDFLKDMMIALNFPTQFVKRIMTCVSFTHYSLILNGTPWKPSTPNAELDKATLCPLYFLS